MSDLKEICRICLKSSAHCKIVDSTCHVNFFIHITSLKVPIEKLWLCIWCNATFKRTVSWIKLALESQSFLSLHYEPTLNIREETGRNPYNLCIHHNLSLDVPALFYEHKEILSECADTLNPGINYESHENNQEPTLGSYTKASKSSENRPNSIALKLKNNYLNSEHDDVKKKEPIKEKEPIKKKRHLNYNTLNFEVKYLNLEEQLNEVEVKKEKNRAINFMCSTCGHGFSTEDLYEEHKLRHSEVAGPNRCNICHLRFKSQGVLSQHQLLHRRRFSCLLCRAQFNRWSHCVAHRHKCGNVALPTACGQCLKIFTDEYSLIIHTKRVHQTDNKYECERCQRKFANKQRLTVHIRSHTGLKPFSCPECERTFTTHSNLRAHRSVHSAVSPHYCVECDAAYKTAKSLRRHFLQSPRHVDGVK